MANKLFDYLDALSGTYKEIRSLDKYYRYETKRSDTTDVDFIQKCDEVLFTTVLVPGQLPKDLILVRKGREERDYIPADFLQLVLDINYAIVDKTTSIKKKISTLMQAEATVESYINRFKLREHGLDASTIFAGLSAKIERYISYKHKFKDSEELSNYSKSKPTNSKRGIVIEQSSNDLNALKIAVNKFNSVPMDIVIKHFILLTQYNSKNGRPYLATEQLTVFLKRAFLKENATSTQEINLSRGEKGFVIALFYDFFELSVARYKELNQKKRYIELVTNNFENWSYSSVESYFKPNKTKHKWQ